MSFASALVRVLAALSIVVLVAACAPTELRGPREWTTAFEGADGRGHAIRTLDTSGLVENAEVDPAGVAVPATVILAPGSDRTLLVPWTGGSCDATTAIDIGAAGSGVAVRITPTPGAQVCDAMAIGHVVALTFSGPISPSDVTVGR